jgi:TP901 family phage tail tape measure protein
MGKFTAGIEIKAFDQFSRVMDSFSRKMSVVAKSTKTAQDRLSSFQNATAGVSAGLKRVGMAAGIAFTAVTALAVKSGSAFETALASLNAMTGQTEGNLEILGESSLTMAEKFGSAASGILDGMTRIASAKSELMRDPAGLKTFTDSAGVLAKISGESFEKAGESVVSMMNIFNDPKTGFKSPTQAIDQLAQSTVKGIMKIGQLQQALAISGGVAALAGLDFAETQAAIQAVGRTGLKTSTIARQMKNIFLRLSIAVPGLKDGTQDFFEVLQKLNKEDLSPKFLKKWLGAENIPAWQGLMANLGFAKDMRDVVKDQSAGKAMEMFNKVMSTTAESAKRLWQVINNQLIRVFNDFLGPVLKKTIGLLTSFARWMFSGTAGAKMFNGILVGLLYTLTAVGAALAIVLSIATWTLLGAVAIPVILGIGKAFLVAIGPIGWAISAILLLVPALFALSAWARSDKETSFFKVLVNDLKDFWGIIKSVFGAILDVVAPIFKVLSSDGGGALKMIGTLLKWILILFVGIGTIITAAIITPIMAIVAIVMGIWKAITAVWNAISDLFEKVHGFKPFEIFDMENIEKAWKKIKDIFNIVRNKLFGGTQEELNAGVSRLAKNKIRNRSVAGSQNTLTALAERGLGPLARVSNLQTNQAPQNNINIGIVNEDGKTKIARVDGQNTNVTTEESITGPGQMNDPVSGI